MRKVYYAAVALLAGSVALSPNVLADSQLQMGGGDKLNLYNFAKPKINH